jgi:hypothetical protein
MFAWNPTTVKPGKVPWRRIVSLPRKSAIPPPYTEIVHGVSDVLFVRSARVRKAEKRARGYTTTAYSDCDPFVMLGGKHEF